MAALRNAISPDFTYSQSYLSLLSASGCMSAIICCASPTLVAIMKNTCHGRHLCLRRHVKLPQLSTSRPLSLNSMGTSGTSGPTWRTNPGQGGAQNRSAPSASIDTILRRPSWREFRVDVKSLASTEDVEKASDSSTGSDVVEWPPMEEAATADGEICPSPEEEVNDGAVALFDFQRGHENELPLKQGQPVWVSSQERAGVAGCAEPEDERDWAGP